MTLPPQLEQILTKVDIFMAKYPNLCFYDKLKDLEEKTNVPRPALGLILSALLSFILFSLGGAKLVTDLVSFLYPAYMSFKTIDSQNRADDMQWLTYWVVFSFISIIENVANFIVDLVPFYYALKVVFFIWLYHPKFCGAGLVYTQVIKPFLLPHIQPAPIQKKVE